MPLFGGGQTAQIIMQGVQLLNNSLQQAAQLQAEREQQDRAYELKRSELEIHQRKLEAEAKFNELDFQIKKLSAQKAESEAALSGKKLASYDEHQAMLNEKLSLETKLKQAELSDKSDPKIAETKKRLDDLTESIKENTVRQNTLKSQQLQIAFDDPNQMNRRFQNIGELSDHREVLQRRLLDPWISDTDANLVREEMRGVDDSLRFRIERAGRDFGLTKEEAAVRPYSTSATTPETQKASINIQSAQAAPSPGGVDVGQLVKQAQSKGADGVTSADTLRRLYQSSVSAGNDRRVSFLKQLFDLAPGETEQDKKTWVLSITK